MVSAFDSGSSGPGSSPAWPGHCIVFLGKTLTLMVPLSTLRVTLRWTSKKCWEGLHFCPFPPLPYSQ